MKIWKVSHGTGFISEKENDELFQRNCVCVHPGTPAKGRSYTSQGENFENIKAGDYFYLCYSNTRIRLFGKFTGKSHSSSLKGKEDWLEQEYELLFEATKNGGYDGEKYWWTPNDNSTFIQVSDNAAFEKYILQPFFGKQLSDIESVKIMESDHSNDKVNFRTYSIEDVYGLSLEIPDYQRIYSWQYEQVKTLLDDICAIKIEKYFIGSVILHLTKDENKNDIYNIVDGQQRLVTLALILHKLFELDKNWNENLIKNVSTFLQCKYASLEAQQNIYENFRTISNYLADEQKYEKVKTNILKITFGALTIKGNENLDLAFTFFSNTNSKGKKLTDYDLLKPHHLRYIPLDLEAQQMHLAKRWDAMIRNKENIPYEWVMEYLLYRLRKWSICSSIDEGIAHHIKKEFEAALVIDEIPPFGEQFNFDEPIQGGQHFFAFVDHFVEQYHNFNMKELLSKTFGKEGSHSWYGRVIEALIFCYYLKFGNNYIKEATMAVVRYISIIRFSKGRAFENTILEWVRKSKIVLDIDKASSPTFFLASMEKRIDRASNNDEDASSGVRRDFLTMCKDITKELAKPNDKEAGLISNSYKNYFQDRYGKFSKNS